MRNGPNLRKYGRPREVSKRVILSKFRVSIVNYNGVVVYDKYVRPEGRVTDFRTWVSGVRPENLLEKNGAISYQQAIKDTHRILNSCKQIVGHSLQHDFKVLNYKIGSDKIRDVSKYAKYKSSIG